MELAVAAVGTIGDDRIAGLCDEYRNRLGHHVSVDERVADKGRGGDPTTVMRQEADRLESVAGDRSLTIAMTEEGKSMTSRDVAEAVNRWMVGGRKEVVFFVGGAYGLAPELKRGADRRWSLSQMTFPHDVARMLLWEQLYRAMTIIRGEPYHK